MSNDVKELIVNLGGLSKNKKGELLGIHRSTVWRVLKKFQEKGSVENNIFSAKMVIQTSQAERKRLWRNLATG